MGPLKGKTTGRQGKTTGLRHPKPFCSTSFALCNKHNPQSDIEAASRRHEDGNCKRQKTFLGIFIGEHSNTRGEPPKCRMGEPVPPGSTIRFLNPDPKNPSSAAWLGNDDIVNSRHCLSTSIASMSHLRIPDIPG